MSNERPLSTTALAKALNLTSQELFTKFRKDKLIKRVDEKWELTELGKKIGGSYTESPQFGRYIVWPASMAHAPTIEKQAETRLTAHALGAHFSLQAHNINAILAELGWIKKGIKGWLVTGQGERLGGIQDEDPKTGVPFSRWPEKIISNRSFLDSIQEVKGEAEVPLHKKVQFKEKFRAELRATDGHFVHSKAEQQIDNWLYMAGLVHAYERKLPIDGDYYCDFYLPAGNVYIEYWGFANNPTYLTRKKEKIETYKNNNFNLIELNDTDIQNLDEVLPRLLLKFGIQ